MLDYIARTQDKGVNHSATRSSFFFGGTAQQAHTGHVEKSASKQSAAAYYESCISTAVARDSYALERLR